VGRSVGQKRQSGKYGGATGLPCMGLAPRRVERRRAARAARARVAAVCAQVGAHRRRRRGGQRRRGRCRSPCQGGARQAGMPSAPRRAARRVRRARARRGRARGGRARGVRGGGGARARAWRPGRLDDRPLSGRLCGRFAPLLYVPARAAAARRGARGWAARPPPSCAGPSRCRRGRRAAPPGARAAPRGRSVGCAVVSGACPLSVCSTCEGGARLVLLDARLAHGARFAVLVQRQPPGARHGVRRRARGGASAQAPRVRCSTANLNKSRAQSGGRRPRARL
jgi:hypothetical protein